MDGERTGHSEELSRKIMGLMELFVGKSLEGFPLQCATKWLGGTLVSVARGAIEIAYAVRPEMTNPSGYLHGGIQAAMLDDCLGIICAGLGYRTAALSVDLHIDFLGSAYAGDTVIAKARVVREGASVINATADLFSSDGALVSRVQSNILISAHPAPFLEYMEGMLK